MNKLTAEEMSWIAVQLKKYKTVFPEFYAEVYDHIVSAIELQQEQGDDRDVKVIYLQIVEDDFNGYKGIQKNATQHFIASRKVLWDMFRGVMKKNRDTNLPFGLGIVVAVCFLPFDRILLNEIMLCISLILAIIPFVYGSRRLGFKNMFSNNTVKAGIIRAFSTYSIHLFNLLYVIIFNGIRLFINKDFKAFNCHPAIAATLMVCILAYDICFIQFYNQEIKGELA